MFFKGVDRSRSPDEAGRKPTVDRRSFLRSAGRQGVSIPAALVLLGTGGPAIGTVLAGAGDLTTVRLSPGLGRGAPATLVRDFADPYLELVRLLREAAEIEHALMVQYLYAGFSVKSAYQDIVGYGDPNGHDLLGVAIQEMQHLGAVNRLLVNLGVSPNLRRQDFPYEPDIYPFPFHLEPLSRASLAKYVYCEAPADAMRAGGPEDAAYLRDLNSVLGTGVRPNHVGTLYDAVIDRIGDLPDPLLADLRLDRVAWLADLDHIKADGEVAHYAFFKSLFLGKHRGFGGVTGVWNHPADHLAYPSHGLPVNPTAYAGFPDQIQDPTSLSVAWLSNLHYWIVVTLLDMSYRHASDQSLTLARTHMLGPVWTLAKHLASRGAGIPFDPICLGSPPGATPQSTAVIVKHLCREALTLARSLEADLPGDYPIDVLAETIEAAERGDISAAANNGCTSLSQPRRA
jgi:hypothetical protein